MRLGWPLFSDTGTRRNWPGFGRRDGWVPLCASAWATEQRPDAMSRIAVGMGQAPPRKTRGTAPLRCRVVFEPCLAELARLL